MVSQAKQITIIFDIFLGEEKRQKISVQCILVYKETSEAIQALVDLLYFILMDPFN